MMYYSDVTQRAVAALDIQCVHDLRFVIARFDVGDSYKICMHTIVCNIEANEATVAAIDPHDFLIISGKKLIPTSETFKAEIQQ